MPVQAPNPLDEFHFTPQPQAQTILQELLHDFLNHSRFATHLCDRMRDETGTRFGDWIDSIFVPASDTLQARLSDAGFKRSPSGDACEIWSNMRGVFPRLVLHDQAATRVLLKVESVIDFLAAHPGRISRPITGAPLSPLRLCMVDKSGDAELWVVERHGCPAFLPPRSSPDQAIASAAHLESFRMRRRGFDDELEGFAHAERLVEDAITDLGVDWAADLFFAAEREYWQRRNRAGQFQKSRQDRLGLGWANHDHHTYRSSREHFSRLIAVFEKLGFICRERFYAGAQAGWGAQVLEQPAAGLVIFADVDLSPDELSADFAHDRACRRATRLARLACGAPSTARPSCRRACTTSNASSISIHSNNSSNRRRT